MVCLRKANLRFSTHGMIYIRIYILQIISVIMTGDKERKQKYKPFRNIEIIIYLFFLQLGYVYPLCIKTSHI